MRVRVRSAREGRNRVSGHGHLLDVRAKNRGKQSSPAERFEAIYAAHQRAVLGYVLRRTDADTAPDVVSDVFLVAWRRLEAVPDDSLPWLLGVARRTLANQRRAARRRDALGERLQASQLTTAADQPTTVNDTVLRAFGRLSEADRELLTLVAWEGLTTRQAAKVLGTTAVAARVRLHRARHRLAAALEAEEASTVVQSQASKPKVAEVS
jgi:RNA polymerase sigma factor (sigma-70 family)